MVDTSEIPGLPLLWRRKEYRSLGVHRLNIPTYQIGHTSGNSQTLSYFPGHLTHFLLIADKKKNPKARKQ